MLHIISGYFLHLTFAQIFAIIYRRRRLTNSHKAPSFHLSAILESPPLFPISAISFIDRQSSTTILIKSDRPTSLCRQFQKRNLSERRSRNSPRVQWMLKSRQNAQNSRSHRVYILRWRVHFSARRDSTVIDE